MFTLEALGLLYMNLMNYTSLTRNIPTNGRVPNGATIERELTGPGNRRPTQRMAASAW